MLFWPRLALKLLHQPIAYHLRGTTPIFLSWHVTHRCNIHCSYCFFRDRMQNYADDLTTEQCLHVVDQLAAAHVPFLDLAGGEPLLRKDLIEIAGRALRSGIYTQLYTNGTLITPELAPLLAKVFRQVFVSIDGTRVDNDRGRGDGVYDRSMAGLKNLLRYRRELKVKINAVIDADSAQNLAGLVEVAATLGVHGMQVHPSFVPHRRVDEKERMIIETSLLSLKKRYFRLLEGDEDYYRKVVNYLSQAWKPECLVTSLLHPAILPDGRVSACCISYIPLGNLRLESFQTIMKRGKFPPEDIALCPGCLRRDYQLFLGLFNRPFSTLFKLAKENLSVG